MKLKLKIFKYLTYILTGIGYIAFEYHKKEKNNIFSWWRVFGLLTLIAGIILLSGFYYVFSFIKSDLEKPVDGCGVVFGAAVWKGDVPSHALNDRIMTGVKLYKDKKINCLVFSGGDSTYGAHEADVMKKIALKKGVSETDITLDYNGKNTLQTLQALNKSKLNYVFISNDFHLARINLIAKKIGLKKFHLQRSKYLNGHYFKENYFFMREIGGVILLSFLL